MDTPILQWNFIFRGVLRSLDDFKELLYKLNSNVLCIQETHQISTQTDFLRKCATFCKDRDDAVASMGGVAIIVYKGVASQQLHL